MRLSRTDLVPALAIVAGGAIGALLTFSPLVLWSPSDDVPLVVPLVLKSMPDGRSIVPIDCADNGAYRLLGWADECALARGDASDKEADVSDAPVFTPMTVKPEILNRSEVQAAVNSEYPPTLRDAGIGGSVVVWLFVSEEGEVLDRRVSESSGQTEFDEAALRVADIFKFSPARNRDQVVQVWIQLPITFQVR